MTDEQFKALLAELQTIRVLIVALLDQGKPEEEPEPRSRYL